MILNGVALIFIFFLICAAAVIVVFLGTLPGKIARKRGHHQADAVNAAAWMGMATGGLLWPLAFIWAFIRVPQNAASGDRSVSVSPDEVKRLQGRLAALEATIIKLQSQKKEKQS